MNRCQNCPLRGKAKGRHAVFWIMVGTMICGFVTLVVWCATHTPN